MALLKMAVLLSLLRVSFTSADPVNITAEPGKTVVLPCQTPNKNNIRVIEYRRADLEPDYVFLHPNKSNQEKQHELFKNRVELQDKQMKDGNVSLVLNHVTFSDNGVYKCHVLSKEGNEKKFYNKTITLTVEKREDEEKKGEGNQQNSATGLIIGVVIAVVCVALAVFGVA
ncbi:butyrophilin subfamily 2 member A2-like isoform 1-T2 [Pholidichthys leucotaenia]